MTAYHHSVPDYSVSHLESHGSWKHGLWRQTAWVKSIAFLFFSTSRAWPGCSAYLCLGFLFLEKVIVTAPTLWSCSRENMDESTLVKALNNAWPLRNTQERAATIATTTVSTTTTITTTTINIMVSFFLLNLLFLLIIF